MNKNFYKKLSLITRGNFLQEYVSISILGLLTTTAKDVSIFWNILGTVVIHIIMTKTFNKTICVAIVAEVILTRMYVVYYV